MTDPERPDAATPGAPTPEEISARLEALLKRTHTLRAERKAAGPGTPLDITWPPPARELDRYDVVDVPDRTTAEPPLSVGVETPRAAPVTSESASAPSPPPRSDAPFARPDWNEVRLRAADDPPPGRSWLWVATLLLGLAAVGQAVYLWVDARADRAVPGRIRVDGPAGADVRIAGASVGIAPLDIAYPPGEYTIEIAPGGRPVETSRAIVGPGRDVLIVISAPVAGAAAPTSPRAAAAPPARDVPSAPAPDSPAVPSSAVAGATVSATTGAVSIESTPPGLAVTMNGREQGVTPITVGQLRPGRHDVLVGGSLRQVDVRAGQVSSLRVSR